MALPNVNLTLMRENNSKFGNVKGLLIYKPCGHMILREFSECLSLQQVWDAARCEYPNETRWTVRGQTDDDQHPMPERLETLRKPWGQALRECGAKPVLPAPEPVVYALFVSSHVH